MHKHNLGDVIASCYVGKYNSDSTEGRGHMVDAGAFYNHEDAHESVKGRAPMGCGDGNVYLRTYYRCKGCPDLVRVEETIYYGDNYTQNNMMGRHGYVDFLPTGWRKDYSEGYDEEEYQQYLDLKKKYGG